MGLGCVCTEVGKERREKNVAASEQRAVEKQVPLPGRCGMTRDLFVACFVPLPVKQDQAAKPSKQPSGYRYGRATEI